MAEGKAGPHIWPAVVEAWKYSTRVAVRSYEMFACGSGEIKAYRCGQHKLYVGMGEK